MLNYLVLTINGQKEYYWASEDYIKNRMREIKNSYEKFIEIQYWSPYEKTGNDVYSTHVKIDEIQKFDWVQSSQYLDRSGDDVDQVEEDDDYEEDYYEEDEEDDTDHLQEQERLKEEKRLKELKDKEDQIKWNKVKAEIKMN